MKHSEIYSLLESSWKNLTDAAELLKQCRYHEATELVMDVADKSHRAAMGLSMVLGINWESGIPPLDTKNGKWIDQKETAKREKILVSQQSSIDG